MEEEQVKVATVLPTMGLNPTNIAGTFAGLVSHFVQEMTLHLAGTTYDLEHIPTARLNPRPSHGHMWHPYSYGTQFTNGTLTIAANGLSLERDWCDP